MVGFIGEEHMQVLQHGVLTEVHLVLEPGLVEERPTEYVVLVAHIDGHELVVATKCEDRKQE